MKTKNIILVQQVLSNRSNAMVWAVYVQGKEQEQFKNYCKSAYTAMRYAFMLKAQTKTAISVNCLDRLSHQIRMEHKAKAEKIQVIAQELADKYSVNKLLNTEKPLPRKASKVVKSTKLGIAEIMAASK